MTRARLDVRDPLGHRVVSIDKRTFAIGRRTGNDLRLAGQDVSRVHAEIAWDGAAYVLRDLESRFGTFVNGAKVDQQALRHGDLVRLGQGGGVEMVFLSEPGAGAEGEDAGQFGTTAGGELRQVATLLEGLRALGSARVLDEVLAMVIDSAIELSGAERGTIMLADPDGRLEFKLARSRGRVTLPGRSFEASRKIPEDVFVHGEPRFVADLLDGDLPSAHLGTIALGIRHVFCMPLRLVRYVDDPDAPADEKRIGVLYLDSRERGTLASHGVQAGLETLAAEAAVAIDNARLYREAVEKARIDHELRIAAEIQQALLPAPCWSSASFEAAGRTVPCRAIGGDFFDYLTLADGRSGFVVADVSGKGTPAALLTAVIQGVLAAQASSGGGPARTAERINEVLIRRAIESRFVTMFLAALDNDGALTYCNAGHNPPFLLSGGTARRLEAGGMVCGLFPTAAYAEETVQLRPGDLLVMFSDGISEALNAAGEEFGDDRILACLERLPPGDIQAVLDGLLSTVREFASGTVQSDDMTAVVVRYRMQG